MSLNLGSFIDLGKVFQKIPTTPLKAAGTALKLFSGKGIGGAFKVMGSMSKNLIAMATQGPLIGFVMSGISNLLTSLNPFKGISDAVSLAFKTLGSVMVAQTAPAAAELTQILMSPEMIGAFVTLGSSFNNLFMAVLPLVEIFMPFIGIFTELLALGIDTILVPIIEAFVGVLVILLEAFTPLFDAFKPILDIFIELIGLGILAIIVLPLQLLAGVIEALSPIITLVANAINWLVEIIMPPLVQIIKGIGMIFGWLGDVIKWAAGKVGGGFAKLINSLIELLNKIPGVDIGLVPVPSPGGFPPFPSFAAEGGILTGRRPVPLIAGEAGEPEMILPLSKAGDFGFGGGGPPLVINFNQPVYGMRDFKRVVNNIIVEYERRKNVSRPRGF